MSVTLWASIRTGVSLRSSAKGHLDVQVELCHAPRKGAQRFKYFTVLDPTGPNSWYANPLEANRFVFCPERYQFPLRIVAEPIIRIYDARTGSYCTPMYPHVYSTLKRIWAANGPHVPIAPGVIPGQFVRRYRGDWHHIDPSLVMTAFSEVKQIGFGSSMRWEITVGDYERIEACYPQL
jgi:hypothetical protein